MGATPLFLKIGEKSMNSRKVKRKINRHEVRTGYLFIMPNLLGFLVFTAIPVIAGFVYSFTNYDGFRTMDFVGLKNYLDLFKDSYFKISLINNFYFTLVSVPLSIVAGLMLAVVLNRGIKGKTFFRSVAYFPNLTSVVAVGVVWIALFNANSGPINTMLKAIGIDNPPLWLSSTVWAMPAVIIVSVWQSAGYHMVLFLGGLQAIPNDLYEAASIDGANKRQQFFNITIPMLSNTIFLVTVLAVIGSFQVFAIIDVMTEGGPGRSTNVLVYRIYQEAFMNSKFGYASAMAFFLALIIFVFTAIQFKVQKQGE